MSEPDRLLPRDSPAVAEARVKLLRTMMVSREFDRRAAMYYRQGGTWFHISGAGHEALAAFAPLLRLDDVIVPHYRDRGLLMARGMSLEDMARDLLATASSGSGGRNMTSHFSDRRLNILSIASPVAAGCLPGVGMAWAARLRRQDSLVLCLVGDASTRQGEFYEALAFAREHSLAVVFVVEDNKYGISTATDRMSPLRLDLLGSAGVETVDGSDPDAISAAARRVFGRVREGDGPVVLWCDLDRLDSHTSADDQRVYRDARELAEMRDPIAGFSDRLLREGLLDTTTLAMLRDDVTRAVEEAFTTVSAEPKAAAETVLDHLYAAEDPVPDESQAAAEDTPETMVAAVNVALRAALTEREAVIFGEDVADPKGGVFGFTKGLGRPDRVVNSPLAEATIVGVGIGLAAAGMRAVVELQFIDFAGPAWNQISAQLATLRWRTNGDWQCPLTVYAPWGAYLPGGGIWHSQSNESLLTHLPGIHVAVPSSPADTSAVFGTALAGLDPTFVLLPKHLLRQRNIPDPGPAAGRARVARPGQDVTVVAWGNCCELAALAASTLADEGVDVEIVELCWLNPDDTAVVRESVHRTGRLVVVQEDVAASSFGASVLTDVTTDSECFYRFLAPPRLVSRAPVHVPYEPGLEASVLPSAEDVAAVVRRVMAS